MMTDLRQGWNQFWFSPTPPAAILPVRIAICSVVAIWFLSFLSAVPTWFGPSGILTSDLAGKMIEYEEIARWQRWSPLWLSDAIICYYGWLVLGIGLSLLAITGIGGRLTLVLLALVALSWANRLLWLNGLVEPAVIAFIAYLAVEPGPKLWAKESPDAIRASWTVCLGLRLIQVHWWILVAAGCLSQLAGIEWWRGDAVWWLAAAERSTLLTRETLRDNAVLVNGLTHAIIAIELLTLWFITTCSARWLGIAMGLLLALAIGLVTDHVLYALLLAACLGAFVPRIPSKPHA